MVMNIDSQPVIASKVLNDHLRKEYCIDDLISSRIVEYFLVIEKISSYRLFNFLMLCFPQFKSIKHQQTSLILKSDVNIRKQRDY